MHSWQALFGQILFSIRQPKKTADFQKIKSAAEPLDRFASVEELIGFLNDPQVGSREEKDAILSGVISSASQQPDLMATARDILLLAMRPALDRIFHSLLADVPESRDREGRLVNDMFCAFQQEIQTWDFHSRTRVAATLKLNVLRKVKRGYIVEQRTNTVDTDIENLPAASLENFRSPSPQETPMPCPADLSRIAEGIRSRLPSLKNVDLHLLVGRFVHDKPFSVLAQELGITEENARQRFNRVKKRIHAKKVRGLYVTNSRSPAFSK